MKAFVFASLDCVAFISQGRHVESTSRIYSSFKCSHIFLAIRRALNDSKRLLSFPWATWHAFERERKMIEMERGGGKGRGRRGGDHSYFFLTREYLYPPLSQACHSDYLFFLIIYDVDVVCMSELYLYIIERKLYIKAASFFPPSSFLPTWDCLLYFVLTDVLVKF